jgi:hypothetical protein
VRRGHTPGPVLLACRARLSPETGENYTSALAVILGETELAPLPEPWKLTGSHAADSQRAGALQIAGPRFATVDETVPVTGRPFGESLPDEPQALDF